jgi:hypothetical protein
MNSMRPRWSSPSAPWGGDTSPSRATKLTSISAGVP